MTSEDERIVPLDNYFEEIRGLLRARRLNRSWALISLGRHLPEGLVLIAIALWWRTGPVGTIWGYLATAALSVLAGFLYLFRYQHTRLVRPSGAIISKYLHYGLPLVPGALASYLSFTADRYLVAYYLDLRQVGIYSACYAASALGFFFCSPLNSVLLPEMAALHDEENFGQFFARFAGVQKFAFALATGGTALLISFPQQVLRILTTQSFSAGAPTLAVLGLQGVFMSFLLLYSVILCVQLRVWWTTLIWAGMGAIVLLLDVILIPRMGIVGAGFSQLISSVAGALLVVGLSWESFRRTFRLSWISQLGTALLGVWVLGRFCRNTGFSLGPSLWSLALGATAYGGLLLVTRYTCFSELRLLYRAVRR